MANGLQVITTRLLVTDVSVDGSVTGGTGQVFAFAEGNVFSLRIFVAFGEAKINDVNVVLGAFGASDKEIVGLDIAMDNSLFVHLLNSLDLG